MYTVVVVYGSYTLGYNSVTAIYHGHSCIHGYKLFDVIVQATYTIALSWFIYCTYYIELYARGTHLDHLGSPRGLNVHLGTIQINHLRL